MKCDTWTITPYPVGYLIAVLRFLSVVLHSIEHSCISRMSFRSIMFCVTALQAVPDIFESDGFKHNDETAMISQGARWTVMDLSMFRINQIDQRYAQPPPQYSYCSLSTISGTSHLSSSLLRSLYILLSPLLFPFHNAERHSLEPCLHARTNRCQTSKSVGSSDFC